MKIIKQNIWDYWKQGYTIVIPTNGYVKKDGSCVMGRGLALQSKGYSYSIEFILGNLIKHKGNNVHCLGDCIYSFPVKDNWWEQAKLSLIMKSSIQLKEVINANNKLSPIYLPKVGCGNGNLDWDKEVHPILNKWLDNRFIIVDLK